MNPFDSMIAGIAIAPGVIKDDADFVANVIDTAELGPGRFLVFDVVIGSIDATLAHLKVMQSDTKTDGTTLGGSPAALLDASTKFTLPGTNDDNKIYRVVIDLKQSHQRYLQLQAKAGNGAAGTYLSSEYFLTNANVPDARGVAATAAG